MPESVMDGMSFVDKILEPMSLMIMEHSFTSLSTIFTFAVSKLIDYEKLFECIYHTWIQ